MLMWFVYVCCCVSWKWFGCLLVVWVWVILYVSCSVVLRWLVCRRLVWCVSLVWIVIRYWLSIVCRFCCLFEVYFRLNFVGFVWGFVMVLGNVWFYRIVLIFRLDVFCYGVFVGSNCVVVGDGSLMVFVVVIVCGFCSDVVLLC